MRFALAGGFMEHNDGRLYYEAGGDGPAIVFIHGFSFDRRMWERQIEHFLGRFRVISYDCRGFGRSSVPTGPYSHADDLGHLLDHLGESSAHLVGLSMGGRIALNYALARPDGIRSLVLIGSDVGGYEFTIGWAPAGDTVAAMRESWLNHEIFRRASMRPGVLRQVAAMVGAYSGFHWHQTDPRWPADTDAAGRLAEISAPTAVLVGEHDLPDFKGIAGLLGTRIPRAEIHVVAEAGHLAVLERPAHCNELIERHVTTAFPPP
jgi:3-oxoadipate enol-lactonase